ncbi:MAG: hypothetical protein K6T83_15085 [Alicyclobacillus sp.]|nr:hypothetical protein [Alicyclobacillus sp.]
MISRRVITASTMTAFLLATGCSQATAPANHASNTTNSTATHKTTNTTNNQTGNTQNSTANSAQPPKYNKADEKKAEAVAKKFMEAQASYTYKNPDSFLAPEKYLEPNLREKWFDKRQQAIKKSFLEEQAVGTHKPVQITFFGSNGNTYQFSGVIEATAHSEKYNKDYHSVLTIQCQVTKESNGEFLVNWYSYHYQTF